MIHILASERLQQRKNPFASRGMTIPKITNVTQRLAILVEGFHVILQYKWLFNENLCFQY